MDGIDIATTLIIAMLIEQRVAIGRMSRRLRRYGVRLKALDGKDDDSKDGSGGHSITAALAAAIALLVLPGCFNGQSRSATEVRGMIGDQVVELEARGSSTSTSGVDVAAVVKAAVAGLRGDLVGAVEKLKPPPPPEPDGIPWGGIAGGALAIGTAAWGDAQRRAKNVHKANEDEAWDRLAPKPTPGA